MKISLKSSALSILFLSTSLLLINQVQAHSGRTDASGCHHDRKNGGYHCHNSGGGGSPSIPNSSPVAPSSNPLNSPGNEIQLPSRPSTGNIMSVQVASVDDGDTISVKSSGKLIKIRFACIDAPEKAQNPWATTSANRLKTLLPIGQVVNLRVVDTDRYGRSVAEVFKAGKSVNLQMVAEGQAVVYPQYINGCAQTKNQYLQSESQAKQQRLGFWNQAEPIMPWNFRKSARTAG